MVKKLFFTCFLIGLFSCAHAQNSLLERTQRPESSFFSFKMPGLPTSWLSCVPGYMSVLKGTVSDWYERFSQATAQIKIADHKELIVGACAVGVVGYLAYRGGILYRNFQLQNEYSRHLTVYDKDLKKLHVLTDHKQEMLHKIRDCIIKNPSLARRQFEFAKRNGDKEPYTLTMADFMSAVAPIERTNLSGRSSTKRTWADKLVMEHMMPEEREEARQFVINFRKLELECSQCDREWFKQNFTSLYSSVDNLGVEERVWEKRYSKYVDPLKQEKKRLEDQLTQLLEGDEENALLINNRLREIDEELRYMNPV